MDRNQQHFSTWTAIATKQKDHMKLLDSTAITQSSIDVRLNELLVMWHEFRQGYSCGQGFAGRDATCRDFQTPTHWDWKNGALDGRVDAITAQGVSDAVDTIPNTPRRWNTALSFEARNLASRVAVWTSPVLPKDREELEILVLEARTMLTDKLRKAGILT
jgi:hypothetical protein